MRPASRDFRAIVRRGWPLAANLRRRSGLAGCPLAAELQEEFAGPASVSIPRRRSGRGARRAMKKCDGKLQRARAMGSVLRECSGGAMTPRPG